MGRRLTSEATRLSGGGSDDRGLPPPLAGCSVFLPMSNPPSTDNLSRIHEAARDTVVAGDVDVMVCGAGPAGVAAAIRAGRAGARTRLVDVHGCLGGVWTAGLLSLVLDANKPHGLIPEIVGRLQRRQAHTTRRGPNFLYDPEQMKLVLEELCIEANVAIQYHTRVVDAKVNDARRLETVVTESKSGRQAWRAKVFIDCTGDGDLGALAGCEYQMGRPEDGATQPMSLMAIIAGPDPVESRQFHDIAAADRKEALLAELKRGGHHPSYEAATLFHLRERLYALMINHEYGVSSVDAQAVTEATIRARREVNHAVQALRSLGGMWGDLVLVASAAHIGVREGRRLCGRATVTADDLAAGRQRADSVCRAKFGMDVHSPDPQFSKSFDRRQRRAVLPYDIPYGALVAAGVDGLMMAGRCISGDFLAHSSYRVTGNAVTMGEAAGSAAAHCARNDCLPHEVKWPLAGQTP